MDTEFKYHCQTHPPLPPPQWCLIDVLEYNCSLRWFYISETLIFFVSDKDGKKKTDTAIIFINSKCVGFVCLPMGLAMSSTLIQHYSPYITGA